MSDWMSDWMSACAFNESTWYHRPRVLRTVAHVWSVVLQEVVTPESAQCVALHGSIVIAATSSEGQ